MLPIDNTTDSGIYFFPFCQYCLYQKTATISACPECGKTSGILGTQSQVKLRKTAAIRLRRCVYPAALLVLIPISSFAVYFVHTIRPIGWAATEILTVALAIATAISTIVLIQKLLPPSPPPRRVIVPLLILTVLSVITTTYWIGVLAAIIPNAFGEDDTYGTYIMILGIAGFLLIPILISIHEIAILATIKATYGQSRIFKKRSSIGSALSYGSFALCLGCPMTWGFSMILFYLCVIVAIPILAFRTQRMLRHLDVALAELLHHT